ncbi:YoaK family protein [Streptomyces sp. NBC_01465]|uniref:YoaK family protein n=1 Tax=Streptomyces sp. NBC_01465 TaxID=2903878 RepID=UPI002E33F132|nr:YoaK family protein [Streptomyces sp. NBC_01465]
MDTLLRRAAARLFPDHAGHHGVLPPLLVVLTVVTGLVDAVSYLGLGRVFVANMTGNVVFLGFALAGDHQLSATASLLAGGVFVVGALAGGRISPRVPDRLRLFAALVGIHAALVAAALAAELAGVSPYVLIALLALGMGLQNAVVRGLAVPDFTTTVLTLTLTGLAADRPGPATVRRLVSVAAMFCGALAGGLLQINEGTAWALAPAVALLAAVALMAARSVKA